MNKQQTAAEIRARSPYEFLAKAQDIVDNSPVINVFAACEWDCMNDDGKVWLAAIVQETLARNADDLEAMVKALREAVAATDMETDTVEHNAAMRLEAALEGMRAILARIDGKA